MEEVSLKRPRGSLQREAAPSPRRTDEASAAPVRPRWGRWAPRRPLCRADTAARGRHRSPWRIVGLCTNGQPERRKRHRVRRCSRRAIRIGLSVASCGFATLMPRQYSNACLAIAATSSVDLTFGSVQSPRWL